MRNIFYFKFIEKNKIQVFGSVKVQAPIIYYNGTIYMVRTEIKIDFAGSKDFANILFPDMGYRKSNMYKNGKSTKIIDIPLSQYYNVDEFAICVLPLKQ
jgi:hypothetical protein